MKSKLFLFLISLLFLFSCNVVKKKKDNKDTETLLLAALINADAANRCNGFWAIDFQTNLYHCVAAIKKASNDKLEIYIQSGLEEKQASYGLSPVNYTEVLNIYSTKIYPALSSTFGEITDINKDGKLTLFIVDNNLGEYTGTYVAGYVDPVNYIEDYGSGVDLRSNMREILYIDGFYLLYSKKLSLQEGRPDSFYSTLSHELQHLLRLPYEFKKPGLTSYIPLPRTQSEYYYFQSLTFDTIWINEGTSEVASDISGYGPQYSRMECFMGDPTGGCSGGFNGKPLLKWSSSILNYSFAYAFMKYLYYNSSTSDSGRNKFFLESLKGNSLGYRANTTKNFFELYKTTENYDSSLLGTDNLSIYKRMYALFLAQTLSFPSTANIYDGNSTAVASTSLQARYTYPSDLRQLSEYPSSIQAVDAKRFILEPSQVYRVKGTVSSAVTDTVIVQGNSEYLIFNSSLEDKKYVDSPITSVQTAKHKCGMIDLQNRWVTKQVPQTLKYYATLKDLRSGF
ncbi:MAG: hypothetical protein H7A25_24760 [Leptospiraceae bacterium]|nr:hypothetical protein [Leptospiraceae bacterium]MCP5503134.1 hypothetical protein [Leptospiraceae bacterium]